jgi:uncharacterized membrane protein YdjX (TVP38/TMEM64 family)
MPAPPARLPRLVLLVLLLALIAGAMYALFFTALGARFRADPHAAGRAFRDWVALHRVSAPLIFLALYLVAGLALLPVMWLQILAGYGFGLYLGVTFSLTGAILAATCSYLVSRTLLADYVHNQFEARHAKLRQLDENLGHNGLLVVMAARLMHFLPFGVSNYLFGVSRITLIDVALGTLLGNIPAITFYVAVGAGREPYRDWGFMAALVALNVLLLVPVALRYWKPEWFRKFGVE